MSLRPEYLAQNLAPPIHTKDGGTLRTIQDSCNYMAAISKEREQLPHWRHVRKLILEEPEVVALSWQFRLAILKDAKLDVSKTPDLFPILKEKAADETPTGSERAGGTEKPMRYPLDTECPVVAEFLETLFFGDTIAMGAPVEDIIEEFERRHHKQCTRCQEYGTRQRVTE